MMMAPQLVGAAIAIRRHPKASPAELKDFQDAQLRRLVCHAYESVPYYRKLFDRHRLHPRHIRGTVDLDLIPTTSKQKLRAQPVQNVVARGLDPERLLISRSSESSDEPFLIRRTWVEQSLQYLLRIRAFSSLGVRLGDRIATVGVMRSPAAGDLRLVGRALQGARVKQMMRIDGLQEPEAVLRQLRAFQPDVIIGMPGMLCRVADYAREQEGGNITPRLLIVGGEVLIPAMRSRLTEAFGAPVHQTYGSHEFPSLGWECRQTGDIHTSDDGVILEVLQDGRPVPTGERGEVVVTNLHAHAMPFIRYRLGDLATRGERRCICGQPFATIRNIQGLPL